jgi:hypothetical protein
MKWIRAIKQWLVRRKLVAALLALALVTLTPALCIKFLAPSHEAQPTEAFFIPRLSDDEMRDPEIAMKYGIRGYVDLTPQDSPPEAMRRGEAWTTTVVLHFVSHTPDLAEVQLHICSISAHTGQGAGTYYYREDGEREYFDYTSLVSYCPGGTFRLGNGETLTVQLAFRVPSDCPESIDEVHLSPCGIEAFDGDGSSVPILNPMGAMVSIAPSAM